jgi:hypothetical protein
MRTVAALAAALAMVACAPEPPDRSAAAHTLTTRIGILPGVASAKEDLADRFAQGVVHFALTVDMSPAATGDDVAGVVTHYLDGLRAADYTGYQTELLIRSGKNLFAVDSGAHPVMETDTILDQARSWVAVREQLQDAAVTMWATIIHAPDAVSAGDRGHPSGGTIELPDGCDYIRVTAAVTTLTEQFPQLSGGNWTFSAGAAHPAKIVTSQRMPTADELITWTALNADQGIAHVVAMTINAPRTPPTWLSEQVLSRDTTAALQLAREHLPMVAALPAPVLYTATDKRQAHRSFFGHSTAPVAITVGGCTPRDYRPDAGEQELINSYETCRR